VGKAFPDWDPPRPTATADVHPSDGVDFLRGHSYLPPWPPSSFPRKRESRGRPNRQAQQDNENGLLRHGKNHSESGLFFCPWHPGIFQTQIAVRERRLSLATIIKPSSRHSVRISGTW